MAEHPYTVTELTAYIKGLMETDPVLSDVWVQGEVGDCRAASSGHWYWTLKDAEASLRCVMWRWQAASQRHQPEEGAAFVLHGAISVYAARGQYQLSVDHLEPVGLGDLYRQFEALKAKLGAEGLFDDSRKRPLPRFPGRIGVVTSPQAAALRDICQVLSRRWPSVQVVLAPTLVQGEGAPAQIVTALAAVARAQVDLVIVARGGGSIEDLWAFNDEQVARAIAACPVPVISGVGHETDFTIADFAADRRAPTPSAAAEIATPDRRELAQAVEDRRDRLERLVGARLAALAREVARLEHRLAMAAPQRRLAEQRRALDGLGARLHRAVESQIRLAKAEVVGYRRRLDALGPLGTLARGYAHVTRRKDGRSVRAVRDVAAGDAIDVRVLDGRFGAVVEGQGPLPALGEEP